MHRRLRKVLDTSLTQRQSRYWKYGSYRSGKPLRRLEEMNMISASKSTRSVRNIFGANMYDREHANLAERVKNSGNCARGTIGQGAAAYASMVAFAVDQLCR